jgi:hypothetical protein
MGVGDEGSRRSMLASFVSQPTNKELCAKVGDGPEGIRRRIVGVFEASTSPLKE